MGQSNKDALTGLLDAGKLEPYIRHVRFPRFKNLKPMLQIDFTYPLTALIGPNGTNKTSILRALEGSTDYVGLGQTWFSTDLDPIDDNRHQVVHGYLSTGYGQLVEAIKTRIQAKGAKSARRKVDPDYFEPSRPLRSAGMQPMPPEAEYPSTAPDRNQTRWKAIDKQVLYLDFRTQISAFDRYFHHTSGGNEASAQQRKDRIRQWSKRLAGAFEDNSGTDVYFGKERIHEGPLEATPNELDAISRILGRNYDRIELVRHNYFHPPSLDSPGWTIRMYSGGLRYSEAFAGSGEFAVTMMVHRILGANKRSLILLDEPEVSLHPGAQVALVSFLEERIRLDHHQVVFATHSPEMVRNLPPRAIKVLDIDPLAGNVYLTADATLPQDAFLRLGARSADHPTIHVEDELARMLVKRALRPLAASSETVRGALVVPLGGASKMLLQVAPVLAKSDQERVMIVLDGDQNRGEIPDPASTAPSEYSAELKRICRGSPALLIDGGNDPNSGQNKRNAEATLLLWMRKFIRYLPGTGSPDELLVEMAGLAEPWDPTDDAPTRSKKAKILWVSETRRTLDLLDGVAPTSSQISAHQERLVASTSTDHPALSAIRAMVGPFLQQQGVYARRNDQPER